MQTQGITLQNHGIGHAELHTPMGVFPVTIWTNGEKNRQLRFAVPDSYDPRGIGYLSCSGADGTGITVWVQSHREAVAVEDFMSAALAQVAA